MTDQEINETVARRLGKGHIQDGWEKVCVIPDYCHSIAAAWEIVEYCTENDIAVILDIRDGGSYCNFSGDEVGDNIAEADTAPMSICLAFLKLYAPK